ncbi:FxsA family protein [Paenisporosarcina antarctica]|uniref:FxsA family protein n=1 Tax=Paenisporosarcina antarctica TaxID=417367 RepID=A0A4P6ZWC5_9BACL|nr:FxsA family protein [Paenisporosarcina antarctica]QBP40672.1 FxsA family protein [Paenisporosarcina antarctica]
MKWLVLILIVVPVIEIGILLWAGNTLGVLPTILIILGTGILGAFLAKMQGLKAIRDVQMQMKNLQAPGDAMVNALFVFAGGIMLLSPGFVTDIFGFLFLFSPTRQLFKPIVYKWIRSKMKKGQLIVM